MNIHLGNVVAALWLSLISLFIAPGTISQEVLLKGAYGFPFQYYTHYHNSVWLIQGVHIDVAYFVLNTLFYYFLLRLCSKLISKVALKNNARN